MAISLTGKGVHLKVGKIRSPGDLDKGDVLC
jgi:hypothetical protein